MKGYLLFFLALFFIVFFIGSISATWWNTDFGNKRNITSINGNITRINVTFDSNMQSDFDDIRFIDSSETMELGYWLEQKLDSNWAVFRVNNSDDTIIYMYYNNSNVTSNSNLNDVYGSGLKWGFLKNLHREKYGILLMKVLMELIMEQQEELLEK